MTNPVHSPRLLMIGLDGADWSLLRPLFADGAMPTLESFVKRGVSATLESVLPTNSMSAWTSLMTGVNPGKHGVYDFVRTAGTPFTTPVTNSASIRAPTIGEMLTSAGMSSCIIDVPPFFPPFEIDGVMMGGVGVLGSFALSHPPDVATRVQEQAGKYADDVPWMRFQGRGEELVERLIAMSESRLRAAEVLLRERRFDFFSVIFVAPDRLQHPYWRDLTEGGPHHEQAKRLYKHTDEIIARLLDQIDMTETDVLIVSDHGFRAVRKMIGVNQLLCEAGLMRSHLRERLAGKALHAAFGLPEQLRRRVFRYNEKAQLGAQRALLEGSRAYSDKSEMVNINLASRESTGIVREEDYRQVQDAVVDALTRFRDPATGVSPVRKATRRDDYFHGEFTNEAPDVMLEFADGYAFSGILGSRLWTWPWLQGAHSRNGIIAGLGPHLRQAEEASTVSIHDVTPTSLSLLGVEPPAGLDGRVATEILVSDTPAVERRAVGAVERRPEPRAYNEAEEDAIKERLRGLGYID